MMADNMVRTAVDSPRRTFLRGGLALGGMGLLVDCGFLPPQAQQSAKVYRLGLLSPDSREGAASTVEALLAALAELGYVEGRNLSIEGRFGVAEGDLQPVAAELVGINPALILAIGTDVAQAVKRATQTIPIVMGSSLDPVRVGLASSLARPGGNVTGESYLVDRLNPKRLELLKQAVPSASRVAVLWNPNHPDGELQELEEAGRAQGVRVESVEVPTTSALDEALAAVASDRPDALIAVPSRSMTFMFGRIGEFAARHRLPVVSGWREFAEHGALLTYGPDRFEAVEHCATQVDKILAGAKPADLPIVQPTTFDFVINLKATQALGLTLPAPLLQQATEIIQ